MLRNNEKLLNETSINMTRNKNEEDELLSKYKTGEDSNKNVIDNNNDRNDPLLEEEK